MLGPYCWLGNLPNVHDTLGLGIVLLEGVEDACHSRNGRTNDVIGVALVGRVEGRGYVHDGIDTDNSLIVGAGLLKVSRGYMPSVDTHFAHVLDDDVRGLGTELLEVLALLSRADGAADRKAGVKESLDGVAGASAYGNIGCEQLTCRQSPKRP